MNADKTPIQDWIHGWNLAFPNWPPNRRRQMVGEMWAIFHTPTMTHQRQWFCARLLAFQR